MPRKKKAGFDLRRALDRLDKVTSVTLEAREGVPEQVHVFDDPGDRSRKAVKSALAAGRPLLVRGEPGVGKTQLAMAAAKALGRPLISFVVDARCESRELLWQFDSVRRLAEAQVCGVLKCDEETVRKRLRERNFVKPGPLWWGFDWTSAVEQSKRYGEEAKLHDSDVEPAEGRVVLIDEIDKADSDLPNGLLEALGSGHFEPQDCERVAMSEPAPLVIITTNEERVLPDAFIRRCLVLHLEMPAEGELADFLIQRGKRHFPKASATLLRKAAEMLVKDRRESPLPRPGQAEFFDLLRSVMALGTGERKRLALLKATEEFTLKKHTGAA